MPTSVLNKTCDTCIESTDEELDEATDASDHGNDVGDEPMATRALLELEPPARRPTRHIVDAGSLEEATA